MSNQDKKEPTKPAAAAKPKQSGYVVQNNSTRIISIYHNNKRLEVPAESKSESLDISATEAKNLEGRLKRFPGVTVIKGEG